MTQNSQPVVSVICPVYNQAKYIREMLEGLYIQQTSFPVEFLIHDDASTDQTVSIINEYVKKDPDRFIPLIEKENQYSQKKDFMHNLMLNVSKGKYLAFCEGDDYYTDPHKLQRQYEVMEANPQCTMCIHQTEGISEDESKTIRMFPDTPYPEGIVSAKTIIHDSIGCDYWLLHTTSFFIRKSCFVEATEKNYGFFMKPVYRDQSFILISAMLGDFYYIDQVMSRYRFNASGSTMQHDRARMIRKNVSEKCILVLQDFDKNTKGRFHKDVAYYVQSMRFAIADCENDFRTMLSKEMRVHFTKLRWYVKLRIYITKVFPWFDKIYYGLRKRLQGV